MGQFKFGDKVWHDKYGPGVICWKSEDGKVVRVIYEDCSMRPSWSFNLKPVSDWIEIDWDDESTLPSSEDEILIYNDGVIMITQESDFYMESYDGVCFATHWQPLPKIPEVKHD
jgi:hypothetical protein